MVDIEITPIRKVVANTRRIALAFPRGFFDLLGLSDRGILRETPDEILLRRREIERG